MPARSSKYAEDWRNRSSHPSRSALRLQRMVATLLALVFLACLVLSVVWLSWRSRSPSLGVVCLPMHEHHAVVAPPIAFAELDAQALREFCASDNDYFCGSTPDAEYVQTEFLPRLRGWDADILVCAVWAYPLWESSRLVFACSDRDQQRQAAGADSGRRTTLPLSDLLKTLATSPAKQKILVVDAGRGGSASYGGIPAVDLATGVQAELNRIAPAQGPIWVLLANSPWEQSHVLAAEQRSVFYHFFAEALRGQADGFTGVADRKIDLAEVRDYVCQHVSRWVWSHSRGGRTQTPLLMCSTAAATSAGAGRVVLRVLPRTAQQKPPEKGDDAKAAADNRGPKPAVNSNPAGTKGAKERPPEPAKTPDAKRTPAAAAGGQPGKPAAESPPNATPPTGGGKKETAAPPPSPGAAPAKTSTPTQASAPSGEKAAAGDRPGKIDTEITEELDSLAVGFPQLNDVLQQYAEAKARPLSGCAELEPALDGWTPIDYAPHLVRRFEAYMASYQGRAVSVPRLAPDQPPLTTAGASSERFVPGEAEELNRTQLAEICRSAKIFLESETRTSWEEAAVLRDILRARNQAIFELPYYIALQTQLPLVIPEQEFYEGVHDLIQSLERLTQALDSEILRRRVSGGEMQFTAPIGSGGREEDLELLAKDVQDHRARLRQWLRLTSPDGSSAEDPLFLFDLLATPLLDPLARARGWSRLLVSSADARADSAGQTPSEAESLRTRQRTRNQFVYRARLELEALLLTCSNVAERSPLQESWEKLSRGSETDDASLSELLVQVGQEIRRHAESLVRRVPGVEGAGSTVRAELTLRLVPAWFADRVKRERSQLVRMWVPLRLREIPVRLVFSPPAGSEQNPLPLPAQGDATFHWSLKSPARAIPRRLKMIVDYPDDALKVTGQGRDLRGTVDWPLDGETSREEASLAIQVRALREDGSKARLTITLPDEGLRAWSEFQLPEPAFLELTVAGPAGTLDGDLRPLAPEDERKGESARRVEFGPSGAAQVTLRPYPSAPTSYVVIVRNPASKDWQVKSTVWTIPAELRQRSGREFRPWDASAAAPLPGSIVQAKNEWTIPAGQTASLPLFPLPPAPAAEPAKELTKELTKEAAKEPTKEAAGPPPTSSPNSADVSGGLLCLLEHAGVAQRLWLDVQPLHPEAYLQPEVTFDSADQRIRIRIKASNPQVLPPGPTRIHWEIPPELQDKILEQYQPPEIDLRTGAGVELFARLAVDPAVQRSVPVVLSADAYPRAFEYECPLSIGNSDRKVISRLNAQVLLCEVDEKGELKRDDRGQVVQVPPNQAFSKLEWIGVLFRADTPPPERVDSDFRLRVQLQGTGAEAGGGAVGESRECYRDRDFAVKLEKAESASGLVLRTRVDELTAVLRTGSYRNQEIVVRGEIERLPRDGGSPTVVKSAECSVWHDDKAPRILGLMSSQITAGDPIAVEVAADATGIATLWYAQALDPAEKMLEPKKALHRQGTTGVTMFHVSSEGLKAGDNVLYLAATDGAGNTADPTPHSIFVMPLPIKPEPPKPMPEMKKIIGKVVYDSRGEGGVAVTLKGQGLKSEKTVSDDKGEFVFANLPPGVYQVQARGRVRNVSLAAPPETVDLTGPEPSATVSLRLR